MTAIIILAAGTSSRLGKPKQTLQYEDQSLLKHAIKAALNAAVGPVIVVIGSNEDEICSHIANEAVTIVSNKHFNEGIASSIKTGITYVEDREPNVENAILMVCDQPYVDGNLLKKLVDTNLTTNKPIVACSYKDTIGVPALFDKSFFPELLSLQGEEGGKKILFENDGSVASIPFPAGDIDIDTAADYEALISKNRK